MSDIKEEKRQHLNQYQRAWQAKHPNYKKNITTKLRIEVLSHYGQKCACCGFDQIEALTIDHINGDGNKHRKIVPTGSLYSWLKKNNYPSGFQVLCANCNTAKGTKKKCPLRHSVG